MTAGMELGFGEMDLIVSGSRAFSGSTTLDSLMPISLAIEGVFDDDLNAEGSATYGSASREEPLTGTIGLDGITLEWVTPEASTIGTVVATRD